MFIPTLVFWISNPKSNFGQIWAKKVQVVCFTWKLVYMLSRGFWFLFQYLFSEFQNLNPFLGKFGLKNSMLSSLAKNWQTERLNNVHSYSNITFFYFLTLNRSLDKFGPKKSKLFILAENWHTRYIEEILIPTRFFLIANLKSIFGQIWA